MRLHNPVVVSRNIADFKMPGAETLDRFKSRRAAMVRLLGPTRGQYSGERNLEINRLPGVAHE